MKFKTKEIKKLGIKLINTLKDREKSYISNFMANRIRNKYSFINLAYEDIYQTLNSTKMYIAKIPSNLSKVNYIYQDKSIYFSEGYDVNNLDEFAIHECIHRLQDKRYKNDKLKQLGICEFTDTKIKGLMFNEAAVQYIVSDLQYKELVENIVHDMKIKTVSDYYPIITNLIYQISMFVSKEQLVKSVLYGDNEFNYEMIDTFGESNFYFIRDSFDKITTLNNNEEISKLYKIVAKKIYIEYFIRTVNRIDQLEDIEFVKSKINEYKEFIKNTILEEEFLEYEKSLIEKLNNKETEIKNRQALVLVKNNIFYKAIINIKKMLNKNTRNEYNKK